MVKVTVKTKKESDNILKQLEENIKRKINARPWTIKVRKWT